MVLKWTKGRRSRGRFHWSCRGAVTSLSKATAAEDGIDFHVMSAAVCATPRNVRVRPGDRALLPPLSSVRLRHDEGLLSRLSVYTRDESSEDELVRYDVGLLFE